jgi:hypothetical protein
LQVDEFLLLKDRIEKMGGVCKNIGIAMGKRDSQIDE